MRESGAATPARWLLLSPLRQINHHHPPPTKAPPGHLTAREAEEAGAVRQGPTGGVTEWTSRAKDQKIEGLCQLDITGHCPQALLS